MSRRMKIFNKSLLGVSVVSFVVCYIVVVVLLVLNPYLPSVAFALQYWYLELGVLIPAFTIQYSLYMLGRGTNE